MSGLGHRGGVSGLQSGLERRGQVAGAQYPIDVVFVVDCTESMAPLLDSVKSNILRLAEDIQRELERNGKVLHSLHARLVAYRDLYDHPESAFEITSFFELPERRSEFEAAVRGIVARGGGDLPESGLEGLFLALRSPWRNNPRDLRRRHIVMLFTDQDAHRFGDARIPLQFAQEPHPKSMSELTKMWGSVEAGGLMNGHAKRLVMFAPEYVADGDREVETQWAAIADTWDNAILVPGSSMGLADLEWETVLRQLVATI